MIFRRNQMIAWLSAYLLLACISTAHSQQQIVGQDTARRPILTAVPFLGIAPDSRSSAMGDVGVALSADANSAYWNVGKLAFIDSDMGASISFSPWLANLVDDMYITYLTGYAKVDDGRYVAASLRYFDLGSMDFTNDQGGVTRSFNPREFAADISYSMQLSERFGMGLTARFIHSNLAGSFTNSTGDSRPANSAAVDIGAFYENKELSLGNLPSTLRLGAQFSNVGIKMTYSDETQRDFLPSNLRLGGALTAEFDGFNSLTFAFDVNKLLVPSPPIVDAQGNITAGKDPNRNLLSGIFGSFADAPDGFAEEMRELMLSMGAEYWYNDLFAARAGYFHENSLKGARQYFTFGAGLRFTKFGFDVSYLLARKQNHPLENTLRFSLMVNLDKAVE